MRVRVTRRVKFCGCGYGWALPVGYVPVAILNLGRLEVEGEDALTSTRMPSLAEPTPAWLT
jgi:hypothetical protein